MLAKSDAISGDDITIEMVESLIKRYSYEDEHSRNAAIDAIKKSIYETVYFSDLHQVAKKIFIGKVSNKKVT
ncbi:hypothetical protein [Xenorhabdus bovienii]|uniref:hypothetical protein n=1 Tax=Xenorhabdus bovienii TaxID=40576 RepID=UPI003DA4F5CE